MLLKTLHYLYLLLRYLVLGILLLALLLLFIIEKPSIALDLTKGLLAEHNISYETLEGGLLSGFKLTEVNYQNNLKANELKLKVDINKLPNRILHINNITLDGVEVDPAFLSSLIDSNSSDANESESNSTLPFDQIIVDKALLNLKNITYQEYHLHNANLKVTNLNTNLKDQYQGEITLTLDSNIGNIDLNSSVNNQHITLLTTINGDKLFINPLLKEYNITLPNNPNITIHAKGEIEGLVNYHITANRLDLNYNNSYQIESKQLKLFGDYSIPNKELSATLDTQLGGNIAELQTLAKSQLDLDDINNTLSFDIASQLTPQKAFVAAELSEQNITILSLPTLNLQTKGTLKKASFTTELQHLQAQQSDITFTIPHLTLHGETSILQGNTQLTLAGNIDSSAGKGDINTTASLNLKMPKESLHFDAQTELYADTPFLNKLLKKEQFSLIGSPKAFLKAEGSLETLTAQIEADVQLQKDTITSPLTLTSTPITVNLKKSHIDGEVSLQSQSKSIDIDLKSRFQGDYRKIETLTTNTHAIIRHLNAFDLNLESITPLQLMITSSPSGAKATIDSKRIQLHSQTPDYDQITYKLKTGNLYLYKIVELPSELKHKFIKLDLQGDATLSQQFFTLKGTIESNKRFKAIIDAYNGSDGLKAQLATKSLNAKVKGDLTTKHITASVETQSLKAVQEELNALYPFSMTEVNGALHAKATLQGDAIHAKITSPKLKLDGFNIEKIDIDTNYTPKRITLNRLNFTTTGFKDKQLNQAFYLKQAGVIHLGEKRDILIDMHPNIKIQAEGTAETLQGTAKIDKLPLGHPDYGSGLLSTNILFTKRGLKRRISGDITLRKLNLYYEAKFLEADYDPDVIIITKKDKQKKDPKEDTFLQHTAIDLTIKAPKAEYKTTDADLDFDVNLKAKKTFGKEVALLGKIEEIEGHVDQVPKRFIVKESNIAFKGGKKINPLLDIHVEYELPQVLIGINIGGNVNRPKLDFTSEPVMPKKDILSYLLFGVSTASLAEGEGSLGREAELFIINQAARDFAHEFDLDRIFIKDDGTREGYAIEAGKNITKNNMVIIESSKAGNSFILEKEFNKNIKLRIGQHQKEQPSQSIDLFFRKKFK